MSNSTQSLFFGFPKGFLSLISTFIFLGTVLMLVQGLLTHYCTQVLALPRNKTELLDIIFISSILILPIIGAYLTSLFLDYFSWIALCLSLSIN